MMKITYINHQKLIDDQYVKEINEKIKDDDAFLLSKDVFSDFAGIVIQGTILITQKY